MLLPMIFPFQVLFGGIDPIRQLRAAACARTAPGSAAAA
jgi:hypothetical protein